MGRFCLENDISSIEVFKLQADSLISASSVSIALRQREEHY